MKEPIGKIVKALGGSPWFQGYVRGKLGHDPVFEEARQAVAQVGGPVIDLGCGAGIFGLWLGVHGFDGSYRGYDLGRWKIEAGLEAAQSLRLQSYGLEVADMTKVSLEPAAIICAFDVLHYLDAERQREFLESLAAAARGGAVLLVRTGVSGCGWRTAATVGEEYVTRLSGWIRGGVINFPRLEALLEFFEEQGCSVESRPLWGGTPFSSYWLKVGAHPNH